MKSMLIATLGALALGAAVSAQGDMRPTCRMCPATYVAKEELQQYIDRAIRTRTVDQQVRAIDVGKSHVDVGVVYRGKLDAPAPNSVAEHDQVSEVYHIIDGAATLMTGPDIVGAQRRPADNEAVRLLNGPGSNGASIRNGIAHQLKAGDVIVIPAGTGHWYQNIPDHITYLMIRIDPDKVTPLKDEAASKADLARSR
jgi:mannose-6-phosphate isomerase-like protein (cupin superfamily)